MMKIMNVIDIIKNTAEEKGYKYKILPSGVLLLFNNANSIIAQIAVSREYYYVNYIESGKFYILRTINKKIAEMILEETLDEIEDGENIIRLA